MDTLFPQICIYFRCCCCWCCAGTYSDPITETFRCSGCSVVHSIETKPEGQLIGEQTHEFVLHVLKLMNARIFICGIKHKCTYNVTLKSTHVLSHSLLNKPKQTIFSFFHNFSWFRTADCLFVHFVVVVGLYSALESPFIEPLTYNERIQCTAVEIWRYFIKIKNSSCSCCWLMVQQRFIISLSVRNAAASPHRTLILTHTNTKSTTQTPITIATQRQQDEEKRRITLTVNRNTTLRIWCDAAHLHTQRSQVYLSTMARFIVSLTEQEYIINNLLSSQHRRKHSQWNGRRRRRRVRQLGHYCGQFMDQRRWKTIQTHSLSHTLKFMCFFSPFSCHFALAFSRFSYSIHQRPYTAFDVHFSHSCIRWQLETWGISLPQNKVSLERTDISLWALRHSVRHTLCVAQRLLWIVMGLDRLRCGFSLYRHDSTHTAAEWEQKTNNSQHSKRDEESGSGGPIKNTENTKLNYKLKQIKIPYLIFGIVISNSAEWIAVYTRGAHGAGNDV